MNSTEQDFCSARSSVENDRCRPGSSEVTVIQQTKKLYLQMIPGPCRDYRSKNNESWPVAGAADATGVRWSTCPIFGSVN